MKLFLYAKARTQLTQKVPQGYISLDTKHEVLMLHQNLPTKSVFLRRC